MSSCARSRSSAISVRHQLDVHAGRQRVLGDAVVQLAGDAVALVVEHLALPGRAQLGLGGDELVVAGAQVVGLAGGAGVQPLGVVEQRAVLQRGGGLAGQDAQHRVVGVVDRPGPAASRRRTRRRCGRRAGSARAGAGGAASVVVRVVVGAVRDLLDVRPDRGRHERRSPRSIAVRAAHEVARAGRPAARRRPARTPPTPRTGDRRRPPRRRAPAPRSPPWCAPAPPRSAPAPGSPGAAARRRSGTRGSSAACRSAGR